MRRQIFQGDLMAVRSIVAGESDTHLSRDFVVVFLVAGNAAESIDVFEEDRVFRVLKFANGMRVAEGF